MTPFLDVTAISELPTLRQYVSGLPRGISSYGHCRASGALVLNLQREGALDGLPDDMRIDVALEPEDWVSEVEYVAVLLAIHDRSFGGDRDRFLDWATGLGARWLSKLALPSLNGQSAGRLVKDTPILWSQHHRGTWMQVGATEATRAELVLEYPRALFPQVVLEYYARVLARAIVRVDGAQPRVAVEARQTDGRGEALFTAEWVRSG